MVRRKTKIHTDDCHFCLTNIEGFSGKSKGNILFLLALQPWNRGHMMIPCQYQRVQNITSAIRGLNQKVPCHTEKEDFPSSSIPKDPKFISQTMLNDLVRDLISVRKKNWTSWLTTSSSGISLRKELTSHSTEKERLGCSLFLNGRPYVL